LIEIGILNIGRFCRGQERFWIAKPGWQISTALMRPSSGRLVIDFFPVPFETLPEASEKVCKLDSCTWGIM
jgi:hypothetical protein